MSMNNDIYETQRSYTRGTFELMSHLGIYLQCSYCGYVFDMPRIDDHMRCPRCGSVIHMLEAPVVEVRKKRRRLK